MCHIVKKANKKFARSFTCTQCQGNIGEEVEQEEKLCDEVKTVREFTYLGDGVSAGGGYVAAVTARTRCGWVKFMDYGELLYDRRFLLELKMAVYNSYEMLIFLYRSEA